MLGPKKHCPTHQICRAKLRPSRKCNDRRHRLSKVLGRKTTAAPGLLSAWDLRPGVLDKALEHTDAVGKAFKSTYAICYA